MSLKHGNPVAPATAPPAAAASAAPAAPTTTNHGTQLLNDWGMAHKAKLEPPKPAAAMAAAYVPGLEACGVL